MVFQVRPFARLTVRILRVSWSRFIGSELIGQNFTSDKYFHPRPSATTEPDPKDPTKTIAVPYAADNSAGSNLGPTNRALIDRVKGDAAKLAKENPGTPIPVDLVTTSASGLDPDITLAAAEFQVPRVAKARNLDPARLRALVAAQTQDRFLGVLNVMRLHSSESAILAAIIFNALIIVALIPLALRGVQYRPTGAANLLRRNLLIYGVGGLIVPFIGIKLIDLAVTAIGLA